MTHVYLIDGTYELFRHFFAVPSVRDRAGGEMGAVRGVLVSVLGLIESGVSHLGVATDHVIESFRNDLYDGYKTGAGIDPDLRSQFTPLESALEAMGVMVWPMVDQEADDALAAAAKRAAADPEVERVLICTPDKDLAQCLQTDRIVQMDRRTEQIRTEAGVWERFGVGPASIPDYLALVGDTADGFPGLKGWGAKSASTVLARYPHLEDIPEDARDWEVELRGMKRLAQTLVQQWKDALLFRDLATLRTDAPVFETLDQLKWRGPDPSFRKICASIESDTLWTRAVNAAKAASN